MNKKTILVSIGILITAMFTLIAWSSKKETNVSIPMTSSENVKAGYSSNQIQPADKIEVVHFHGTQQCTSCIAVGNFAQKTIIEKFPEEFKSGKIVFKEINAELTENKDIVIKYQARGSSLFVNAIHGEKDSIKEDTTVWRLVGNENQYISYFENKLRGLLGK